MPWLEWFLNQPKGMCRCHSATMHQFSKVAASPACVVPRSACCLLCQFAHDVRAADLVPDALLYLVGGAVNVDGPSCLQLQVMHFHCIVQDAQFRTLEQETHVVLNGALADLD